MTSALGVHTRSPASPWSAFLALPLRLILFAIFQGFFAAILVGVPDRWHAAAAWWPLSAALANLVTVATLLFLFRAEGESFWALFCPDLRNLRGDLLTMVPVTVAAAALAVVPNIVLAGLLFANPEDAAALLVQPLPLWAVYLATLAFPLTIAVAELPLYFGYAMRRIETQTGRAWVAVVLPSLFLAAQHVTLPLLLDWRFAIWRLLMFVPFALFVGVVLHWRPRLLPYFVVLHALLDAATMPMFFMRAI